MQKTAPTFPERHLLLTLSLFLLSPVFIGVLLGQGVGTLGTHAVALVFGALTNQ